MYAPPISTYLYAGSAIVHVRPPTRSLASRTRTSTPCWWSSRAADRPLMPPPRTSTVDRLESILCRSQILHTHKRRPVTDDLCISTVPNLSALRSAARGDLVVPRSKDKATTRQPGILSDWSGRLEQSPTAHSFRTYIINFQKHAQVIFSHVTILH